MPESQAEGDVLVDHLLILDLQEVPWAHSHCPRFLCDRAELNRHERQVVIGLFLDASLQEFRDDVTKICAVVGFADFVDRALVAQCVPNAIAPHKQPIASLRFPLVDFWHRRDLLRSRGLARILLELEGSKRATAGELPIYARRVRLIAHSAARCFNALPFGRLIRAVVLRHLECPRGLVPKHGATVAQVRHPEFYGIAAITLLANADDGRSAARLGILGEAWPELLVARCEGGQQRRLRGRARRLYMEM
mmetsp:Transcript_23977/g.66660  ORF Transcript_23977/g.66660 Transcript_23977/m.66660 type:complete len:250 (-) Transcript_23977:263-1012(-)